MLPTVQKDICALGVGGFLWVPGNHWGWGGLSAEDWEEEGKVNTPLPCAASASATRKHHLSQPGMFLFGLLCLHLSPP